MSNSTDHSNQCLLPSELTPKQLESLSFVPGTLSNFNEKEKLPPTARAQWAYVQLNPIDFLNRFTNELGLLGVKVAICFINKENYEDSEKDLKTPITVNLTVQPEQIEEIGTHLAEKKLSHQVLGDEKGFALPYLGSIQKTVDALGLERFISYVFIKNSISREAYSTWISVPKKYLETKQAKAKKVPAPIKEGKEENSRRKPSLPSESKKQEGPKENFNYVIYEETGETVPPMIPQPEEPKPQSVVVATPATPEKESVLSKLSSRFSSKDDEPPCPTAKFDSALFLFLGLFNFYCSILLLTFLGTKVEAIGSVMVEAVTVSAFASLLFAILVIRPSFRLKKSRFWALFSYVAYTGVAGFQIFRSFNFPESPNYLVPGAVAFVCIMAAIVSAFMRIDRIGTRNSRKGKEASSEESAAEQINDSSEQEAVKEFTPKKVAKNSPPKTIDLPAPVKSKAKRDEAKKIELKPAKKSAIKETEEPPKPELAAKAAVTQKPVRVASKAIPATPITEAQKDAIRRRLSRKENLTSLAPGIRSDATETKHSVEEQQKPLSTAEIKARLAERLQQTRATNSGLNGTGKPKSATDKLPTVENESTANSSIQLKKSGGGSQDRINKLSLPNS